VIGVFVTFRFEDDFDERRLKEIAEGARSKFEGMPNLRSKAFTVNAAKREAVNFYVWNSEAAAQAFFTDEMIGRIGAVYGVRPTVELVQIATLVDNA
jgi:hypothetical protein